VSTLLILYPVREQIEFAGNSGMATGHHVGEKDADLAILHLAGRSAIPHANARRFVAAFGETALINDQECGLLAEVFQDILA
jgi:hypothetical protein